MNIASNLRASGGRRTLGVLGILGTLCATLAACTATTPAPVERAAAARPEAPAKTKQQLSFKLGSGVYRCESGQQVDIQRETSNANQIGVTWQGVRHTLRRAETDSGLPRYEERGGSLTWIDLPWKSMLMDSANGRPLANDCKVTQKG